MREILSQMHTIARQSGDETLMMIAHISSGAQSLFVGDLLSAHDNASHAVALYDHAQHKDLLYVHGEALGITALCLMAFAAWMRGHPDQAEQCFERAMQLAEDFDLPFCYAGFYSLLVVHAYFCGDVPRVRRAAEKGLTLTTEHQFIFYQAITLCFDGWARCEENQAEAGFQRLQEGIAICRPTGTRLQLYTGLMLLAQSCLRLGLVQEGLDAVAEALREQHDIHWLNAELYRTRGELLLARERQRHLVEITRPGHSEAEACFQRALDIAAAQGAQSWALRTMLSRCRLWQQQGRAAEAYRELQAIYDAFTEGFQTKDLREAQALLMALAASQSA